MSGRGMKAVLVSVLTVAGLAYAALCAFLFVAQRSMLYFPTPEASLPGAERISLKSGAETLRIWARPTNGPHALIYFGGNAEDVGWNLAPFAGALPGQAIYLVNYRGYGGSTGSPTEEGLFADALAVFDWVRVRHPRVSVIGTSLGSGVAAYLASSRPVDRLVLVTPFDSIANVAAMRFPILPVSLLLKDRFDSASRLRSIDARTLIIVAADDEVIPRARTDALIAQFPPGQLQAEVIEGAGHNTVAESPRYLELIAGFLKP